jgi:ATP-dependent DNA helicase RecQ
MGFDKPDLGFVVHVGAPSSPVAYYQQVGRAGRATERADVLLLPGHEDADIWQYFATASMPQPEQARAVIAALEASGGSPMSTPLLETVTSVRRTRLELLLKVLDVEGAVTKVSGGWAATGVPWQYDAERYERVAGVRKAEAAAMVAYERGECCRMRFLAEALDDPWAEDCGRCDVCAGRWFPDEVPAAAHDAARASLAKVGVPIAVRAQWPSGMDRLGVSARGSIPAAQRVEEGRALARLTDLGWGQRLRTMLGSPDAPADDALLGACVEVLKAWPWQQRPAAVAAIASRRRPMLIESVGRHLAQVGRLEWLGFTRPTEFPDGRIGSRLREGGANSAWRLADVWQAFGLPDGGDERLAALTGPVLLVDDLVDSRWTFTVSGLALRQAGAPGVLPFALAVTG